MRPLCMSVVQFHSVQCLLSAASHCSLQSLAIFETWPKLAYFLSSETVSLSQPNAEINRQVLECHRFYTIFNNISHLKVSVFYPFVSCFIYFSLKFAHVMNKTGCLPCFSERQMLHTHRISMVSHADADYDFNMLSANLLSSFLLVIDQILTITHDRLDPPKHNINCTTLQWSYQHQWTMPIAGRCQHQYHQHQHQQQQLEAA